MIGSFPFSKKFSDFKTRLVNDDDDKLFCGMVDQQNASSLIGALSGLGKFLVTKSPLK